MTASLSEFAEPSAHYHQPWLHPHSQGCDGQSQTSWDVVRQ